jgi:hypothetical protein
MITSIETQASIEKDPEVHKILESFFKRPTIREIVKSTILIKPKSTKKAKDLHYKEVCFTNQELLGVSNFFTIRKFNAFTWYFFDRILKFKELF